MKKSMRMMIVTIVVTMVFVACKGNNNIKNLTEEETKTIPAVTQQEEGASKSIETDPSVNSESINEDKENSNEVITSKQVIYMRELQIPFNKTKSIGDGLIGFQDPATELWGYCDYEGNIVLQAKYRNVNAFSDGYAFVGTDEGNSYIDKAGSIIYSGSYSSIIIIPFTKDKEYAYIEDNFKYYLIDKTGNVIGVYDTDLMDENFVLYDFELRTVLSTTFHTYVDALIFDRTEKYGVFDCLSKYEFDDCVIKNRQLEVVVTGKEVKKIFPDLTGIGITDDYIAVSQVEMKNSRVVDYDIIKTGLIDYDLNVIIEPGTYAYIIPLGKDHIIVSTYDKQYGLVNSKGEFLIELSKKQISLMLTKPDYNSSYNDGMMFFQPIGDRDNGSFMYNYKIINKSGYNYILLENEGDSTVSASCEVYDLDQNKFVRSIPKYNRSHQAPYTYLLKDFTLTTEPLESYDYDAEIFINGVLPDMGFVVDTAIIEEDITYLILDSYNTSKYIEVKKE